MCSAAHQLTLLTFLCRPWSGLLGQRQSTRSHTMPSRCVPLSGCQAAGRTGPAASPNCLSLKTCVTSIVQCADVDSDTLAHPLQARLADLMYKVRMWPLKLVWSYVQRALQADTERVEPDIHRLCNRRSQPRSSRTLRAARRQSRSTWRSSTSKSRSHSATLKRITDEPSCRQYLLQPAVDLISRILKLAGRCGFRI